MRLSLFSSALCGGAAVSALVLPASTRDRRGGNLDLGDVLGGVGEGVDDLIDDLGLGDLIDLGPFLESTFDLLDPEQAKAEAAKPDEFDPSKVDHPVQDDSASDSSAESGSSNTFGGGSNSTGNGTAPQQGAACSTPAVRLEWRDMPDSQKAAFVQGLNCLMNTPSNSTIFNDTRSVYEDLVEVHRRATANVHMVAQFLPWHRYYLNIFETLLKEQCGYTDPIPWWDETKDAGNFSKAPMFTPQYLGSAPVKTQDGKGTCITKAGFGKRILHIGPGNSNTEHCLSRAVDESLSNQTTWEFVGSCNSHANYSRMESCTEMGPHAYGHNSLGAVMADVASSPGDPSFFLHHGFVDHNYRAWQNADLKNRLYQINGWSTKTEPKIPLTLDHTLSSFGYKPDVKVRDVLDTMGGYLCYSYNY